MIEDIEEYVDMNGILTDQKPAYYKMLNTKVVFQLDKKILTGQVKQRAL